MFLFVWPYFSRLASVLLIVLFFWLFLGATAILSVLLLLSYLFLLFRVSLLLLLCEWLPLFGVLFSFLFSIKASSFFLLAFSSLLGLFRCSELELLRKSLSFCWIFALIFFFFGVVSLPFFGKCITNSKFEMSRQVTYHFSFSFMKRSQYFSGRFLSKLILLFNFSLAN